MRRALMTFACGALALACAGCESTEQQSARLGREGRHLLAAQGRLSLGAVNPDVRVSNVTLLDAAGRTAVALRLTSTAARPEADVPVLLDVLGAGGKALYSNATGGLESSLQRMALLEPGKSAWWVNDQILTSQHAGTVRARVGRGKARIAATPPAISANSLRITRRGGLNVLDGELVNHSRRVAKKVPVFAVTVRGGRVTSAGRAVVAELPGGSSAPVAFQIFLVGDPTGSSIQLTVAPTAS